MTAALKGIYPMLLTPFNGVGDIDPVGLDDQIDFVLNAGASGVALFGLAGEGFKLTEHERLVLAERVGRLLPPDVRAVAAVEQNSTKAATSLARRMFDAGIDALMALPPIVQKPSTGEIFEYYSELASATPADLVIQDAPRFSGVALPVELLVELSTTNENITHVKVEAPPTAPKIAALSKLAPNLVTLGGMGGRAFVLELQAGASGTMVGPVGMESFVQVHRAFEAGDLTEAQQSFDAILPLIVLADGNDSLTNGQKHVLARAGIIPHATVRHPTEGLDPIIEREWNRLANRLGLI